jgi:uncharacterized protein YodC (DUF2158 family)
MSDDIRAGDIVRLKFAGPVMTVTKVKNWSGVMTAWCEWMEGSTNQTGAFPVSSLKRAA